MFTVLCLACKYPVNVGSSCHWSLPFLGLPSCPSQSTPVYDQCWTECLAKLHSQLGPLNVSFPVAQPFCLNPMAVLISTTLPERRHGGRNIQSEATSVIRAGLFMHILYVYGGGRLVQEEGWDQDYLEWY